MVLLMGIAGSGKGTQGQLLAATRRYHVISTGELLRNYGSADQHTRMKTGELISDEEVTELLDKALQNLDDQNRTILDGFPRSAEQAKWLVKQSKNGRFEINYVLHLLASREAVKARLHERGRIDDHHEAIEARFKEYEQATLPILDYLKKQGLKVIEINGEAPIPEVHKDILEIDGQWHPEGAA